MGAGPADDQWRTACVHELAAARMARWKSAARHDDDLDLALQAIESELENQPGESNLLAAAVGVLLQRSQPGDLEKAAYHGERLAAGLKADDPDVSDQLRTLARLETELFDQSGDPGHLDKGIGFAQRAASPRDDPGRVQERENVLAWLLAARAGTLGRRPGDSARAAALARRDEAASPIPELELSSIRAGSRACLAEGDWAGAARSVRRALGLLSELTGETGPDVIEDWLSGSPRAWPRWEPTAWCGRATRSARPCSASAPPPSLLPLPVSATLLREAGISSRRGSLPCPPGSVVVQLAVTPVGAVALVTGPSVTTISVDLPALTEDKLAKWSASIPPGQRHHHRPG